MVRYLVQIEKREGNYPTAIGILEEEFYKKDTGRYTEEIENDPNIKIFKNYPFNTELRLMFRLGKPLIVGENSKIFVVPKHLGKKVGEIFNNLEKICEKDTVLDKLSKKSA